MLEISNGIDQGDGIVVRNFLAYVAVLIIISLLCIRGTRSLGKVSESTLLLHGIIIAPILGLRCPLPINDCAWYCCTNTNLQRTRRRTRTFALHSAGLEKLIICEGSF